MQLLVQDLDISFLLAGSGRPSDNSATACLPCCVIFSEYASAHACSEVRPLGGMQRCQANRCAQPAMPSCCSSGSV